MSRRAVTVRRWSAASAVGLAVCLAPGLAGVASAEPLSAAVPATEPMDVADQVTDEAGVLGDLGQYDAALQEARDAGIQLFVVYVDSCLLYTSDAADE